MGVEKGKNWEGEGRAADGEEEVDKVELGKVYKVEGVERVAIFFSRQQLVSRSLAHSACNLLFNLDVKPSSRQDLVVVCHHCHCKRQLATR